MRPAAAARCAPLLLLCVAACDPAPGTDDTDASPAPCAARPLDDDAMAPSTIFLGGVDGYPVVRIPALTATASGALIAVAEGRQSLQDPGAGDMKLVARRSEDCGETWSDVQVVDDHGADDAHNPVLIRGEDADGVPTAWLLSNRRPATAGGEFDLPTGLGPDSSSLWVRETRDDGVTWSAPRELTEAVKDPDWAIMSFGPGTGIQTRWGTDAAPAGRLIAPGWYTEPGVGEGSFVILSDDFGETWRLGGVPTAGTGESQVVERTDGTIVLDAREGERGRTTFTSDDGGTSWSAPQPGIPMTPVMSSVIRHSATRDGDDEDLLLHSGLAEDGRYDMRVWTSRDEGATWGDETVLLPGFAQYSVLTKLDDGTVGVAVESRGDAAADYAFDVRWIRFDVGALGAE